jgi:hypothetical protein
MKGPRKTYTKDEQLPIKFTGDQLRRAERAAAILTEREGERVTKTEVLRDGGNRYVDEILAGQQREQRQRARRLTDPPSIAKAS